jgi:hypothetical protein
MPVSKRRIKNSKPTQSKKMSTQLSGDKGSSPKWFVVIMSSFMILGVLIIVLNYLTVLPGSVSRWYLWSGLGMIGAGFLMTTNYN